MSKRLKQPHSWGGCDPEARYSIKRDIEWQGYKSHLTETCEPDAPHLIVHVETTVATEQDIEVVETEHQRP